MVIAATAWVTVTVAKFLKLGNLAKGLDIKPYPETSNSKTSENDEPKAQEKVSNSKAEEKHEQEPEKKSEQKVD
jgi:hypothetical protein